MDHRQVGMTHARKSPNQHHQNQQTLNPRSQTESQQLESQKLRNPIWMVNELNLKLELPRIRRIPHRQSGDLAGQVEASRREARVPREGDPVSALPTTPCVSSTNGSSPCCLLDVRLHGPLGLMGSHLCKQQSVECMCDE